MLYGRHRKSIVDIEGELLDIFYDHPESHENEAGQPVIPANHLVDVFRTYSENHDGLELITAEEEEQLNQLIESNPGLEVTPQVLIEFIAMRAAAKAREEAEHGEQQETDEPDEEGGGSEGERGRTAYWEGGGGDRSRSSSEDSAGTSVYRSRPPSRGPPVPPKTPSTPSTPFDASRRQRTTPLGPPSSWTAKRPIPAARRKSVDGGHSRALSDSEFASDSPSAYKTGGRRSRAPSNPVSPKSSSQPNLPTMDHYVGSPPSSFSRPPSRPQSRSASRQSQRSNSIGGRIFSTPSPHGDDSGTGITPPSPEIDISSHRFRHQQEDDDLSHGVNSLPMPRGDDSDSDSDNEDRTMGLVMDRSAASSTVSLEPSERLEALQKTNQELGRKLYEAERMLQLRLNEHELELEEMQSRLEEAKSELSATKREEKELRAKEKQNSTQILALESEIAKLQKSLDNSRTAYQSLQKQYQEQCAESERYRNALRRRDEEIKDLQEAAALQSLEGQKWLREQNNYEERITVLENELVQAQQTHAQLEEQKQENMLLKETIDRMRFDMDELRNSQVQGASGGAGASAKNTISKSLGAELLSKMKDGMWDEEEEEEEDEGARSEATTAVEEEGSSGTEGEDVIQTIITRTKKRVARSGKVEKVTLEEVKKEYTDTATQYEAVEFLATAGTQTDPEPKILRASAVIQTEAPPVQTLEIQTEPEPVPAPKVTVDMDIQTDIVADDVTVREEEGASSSTTVVPPTPKSSTIEPPAPDMPPSYSQTQQDEQLRIAAETLHKWHPGVTGPFETVATGISEDAIEEWKALKEELGVDCLVIDKILEDSPKTGEPRPMKDGKRRKSGRFYNIYNTYVYGSKDGNDSPSGSNIATQVLLCVGASALVFLAMRPLMVPHYVHTGPSYYDRMAWNTFNSMYPHGEGFSADGTAAVWSLFGRMGGGAARIVRGWPT